MMMANENRSYYRQDFWDSGNYVTDSAALNADLVQGSVDSGNCLNVSFVQHLEESANPAQFS